MTSDDELLKLETAAIQSIDGDLRGPALKAAARIRELEATLKESDCINEDQAARIRELEAELEELDFLRHEGHTDSVAMMELQLKGVKAGTHVIVPVEPTPEMEKAGASVCCGYTECLDVWEQMIRAAQSDATD